MLLLLIPIISIPLIIYTCCKKLVINKYYSDKKENIEILSYNVNNLPFKCKDLNLLNDLIKDKDIVYLQEVFMYNPNIRKWLKQISKKYKFNVLYIPKINLCKFRVLDSGLVILSKFDFINYKFIPFKKLYNIDYFSNKGILHATIIVNNRIIYLYNIHNQSIYNKKITEKQVNLMRNNMEYFNLSNKDIIIGGDFNIDYKLIKDKFPDMKVNLPNYNTCYTLWEDNKEVDSISYYKKNYNGVKLDYFLTKNLVLEMIDNNEINEHISDHRYIHGIIK